MVEFLKRQIRLLDARFSFQTETVSYRNQTIRLVKTIWWNEIPVFGPEIFPYFEPIEGQTFESIIDAGAAHGGFSVLAALLNPRAHVYAFEPSPRQRALLSRNAKLNGVADRIHMEPCGLWNEESVLAFRTHAAISSLKVVSVLPDYLAFDERVPVARLDHWARLHNLQKLDLIKMDIEGAESAALAGATETLRRFRPQILLQAYHIRDGSRTLERCAATLKNLGYSVQEIGAGTGFLFCTASRSG
jgi:FkbM family methyltransferase